STKVNPDFTLMRAAPASAARRATTRNKISKTGQQCAPRQPQLRVAQTPGENQNTQGSSARRASPSCALRRNQKEFCLSTT
ncbi:hypothetical protein A2U01_0067219, partial [Trifolium medium]|nr:hypothetical protein [Trifolium medium]